MALPSGYTPLEYIESTGSQYVDTKLVINKTDSYEYILDSLLTNGTFGGANGYLQFEGSISGGKRVTIRVSYDGSTHVTTVYVDGVISSTTDWTSSYSGENVKIGILRMGNAGDVWYASDPQIGKVYSCKIKKNGILVRDLVPCTTPSGEVGLYDDVNGVFYGDAAGVGFVAGPVAIYTELAYIESNGTQHIDLKYKPSSNTRVVMECENLSHIQAPFFGARTTSNSYSFFLWDIGATSFRSDYSSGVNSQVTGYISSIVGKLSIDKNKNICTVNSVTVTNTEHSFSCAHSMFLFTGNTAGAPYTNKLSMRVSVFKVYENGISVRDCIPVQRQDGIVGLLDKVNNVFYPDATGGNFIAGPVAVQPESPETLEIIGTTQNAVVLAWPAVPVDQMYRLYRDGVVVYEGTALHYTDAGLAAGSVHTYSIHGVGGTSETVGVTAEATTTEGIVLITDRTAADVSAGRQKGYYNALDLIRVGEAMAYLEERFAAVGISVTVSPKLDWQISDIPTHAQALHYLTDIGVLRGKLTEFRETVSQPGSLTALSWGSANDIEIILLDAEKLIRDIILSYRHYSGRTISGVNVLP